VGLSPRQTTRLLQEAPAAYGTRVNEVLLTALGIVLCEWGGLRSVLVDVEGHGREDVGADVDVSRTVGWFTSSYPVTLTRAGSDLGDVLRRTKEHLRAVPRRGLGYGILRYLADAVPDAGAEVGFNYLGQSEQLTAGKGRFRPAGGSLGRERSDQGERAHPIEINGLVSGGRLELTWTYSGGLHEEATVARLAQRYIEVLGELIEYCCRPDAGGYTPSDFPLAGLSEQTLDAIQRRFGTAGKPPLPG
jgi:non-ribosomal peptide synthase protein (TIGR01720 family)